MWTIYCISRHPKVQAKLHEEIDQIFSSNSDLTHAEIKQMEYLSLVLEESHRLYPPVPFISRQLSEDIVCSTGQTIPAHTWVSLNIIGVHRNPEIYDNPMLFIPERKDKRRDTFSYVPFSAGPRNCIGQQFALTEEKIILAYLLRSFEFIPGKEARPVPRFILGVENEFEPDGGIQVQIKKRDVSFVI